MMSISGLSARIIPWKLALSQKIIVSVMTFSGLARSATKEEKKMPVTVGRIVHYIAYNGTHLAAMVLAVDEEAETVDLAVFTALSNVNGVKNGGLQFHFDVHGGPENVPEKPGTWVWPPRV